MSLNVSLSHHLPPDWDTLSGSTDEARQFRTLSLAVRLKEMDEPRWILSPATPAQAPPLPSHYVARSAETKASPTATLRRRRKSQCWRSAPSTDMAELVKRRLPLGDPEQGAGLTIEDRRRSLAYLANGGTVLRVAAAEWEAPHQRAAQRDHADREAELLRVVADEIDREALGRERVPERRARVEDPREREVVDIEIRGQVERDRSCVESVPLVLTNRVSPISRYGAERNRLLFACITERSMVSRACREGGYS